MTRKNNRARTGVSRRRWFAILAAAAVAVAGDASAIERCVGEYGEVMFTQSCPGTVTVQRQRPLNLGNTGAVPASAGVFCARTPQQLEQQVRSALATRNGIRLSGLALWRGVSARAARFEARELLELLKAGSASVALETASAYPARDPYEPDSTVVRSTVSPAQVPALVVMPVSERQGVTHSQQLRFDLVRDHGCYWLNPRPQRVFDESMQTLEDRASDTIEPVALRGR